MPIVVECSTCGKKYRFADERAGESIPCKECGSDIDVPGGRRRSRNDDDAPSRKRPGRKRRSSEDSSSAGFLIGAGVGAVVFVVALVVLFFAMKGKPNQPANPIAANPDPVQPVPPAVPVPGGIAVPPAVPNATPNQQPDPTARQPARAAGSGFQRGGDQGGLADAFAQKPVQNWKVAPDPGPAPVAYDLTKSVNVRIKDGYIKDESLNYPVTPSPFALIGTDDVRGGSFDIWNLSSVSKTAVPKGAKITGTNVALSPDGKYVAWFRHSGSEGGIEVWDTAAKKALGTVAVDSRKFNIAKLAIPTPARMVALSDVHRGLLSWKLPSGDLEHEATAGENFRPGDRHAFSPGGRYVALLRDFLAKTITIYDFETGQFAGDIEFVKRPPNEVLGMAFSYDGQELAVAFDGAQPTYGERIVIWKTSTGEVVDTIILEDGVKKEHNLHGKATSLQWFPSGKQFLLHGIAIIDRGTKKAVYSLGKPQLDTGSLRNRHVLDNGLVATWDGSRQDSTLKLQQIKDEDISRSVATVEAGGLLVDAKLPRLTKFDATAAVDRSGDKSSGWQVSIDPSQAAAGPLLDRPLAIQGTGQLRSICVSQPQAGLAFVRMAEGEDDAQVRNRRPEQRFRAMKDYTVLPQLRVKPLQCKKNWIDVYDLNKRESKRRIDVDFSCDLIAASPDGGRILVDVHDGQGRLDIFDTQSGSHVAGCRPFQAEVKDDDRDIQTAFFVNADYFAAMNFENRLIVIKLPECQPVYELNECVSPVVSPGGKMLAVGRGSLVELRDSVTGTPRGSLETGGSLRALTFHPDGDRLAAISFEKRGWFLHNIDLKTGRAAAPVPLPEAVQTCHWCGNAYLLLNNKSLFDVDQRTVAWSYDSSDPNIAHVALPPDNRHWYAAKVARGASVQIVAAELPDASALSKLTGVKLEPRMLVQPGSSVTVTAKIAERPDGAGFQSAVMGLLKKAVDQSGVKDSPGQSVKLVVNVELKLGNMVPVKFFGAGAQQEVKLQEKTIEISVGYDSGGAILWRSSNNVSNIGVLIRVPSIDTAQKAVDDQMWDRARGYFDTLQLPSHVFSKESVYGMGTSTLTGDGIQLKGK